MIALRIIAAGLVLAALSVCAPEEPKAQEWVEMATLVQTFAINGVETKADIHPRIRTWAQDGRVKGQVEIHTDLNDFKRVASSLVLWRRSLDVLNTALVLKGRDFRPDPPGVVAEGIFFMEGSQDHTDLRARLVPLIVDNTIRLRAEPVERMEEGFLKTVLDTVGLGELALNPLVYILNRFFSGEDARLDFPPELKRFDPVFKSVAFTSPEGGLALDVAAELDMEPEELPYLMEYISHLGQ